MQLLIGVQEVAGSNPVTPTSWNKRLSKNESRLFYAFSLLILW